MGDKKNKGSGKKEVVMSGDTSRRRQEKKKLSRYRCKEEAEVTR